MIKFEEHDGLIFRMLEGPVPLTADAELPCLVRLIQDDTMLGKTNKMGCHQETLSQKIICIELTGGGLFMNGDYTYRYEIIGYPVAEGSAEWALYQMMKGKKVTIQHLQDSGNVYWCFCDRLRCVEEFNCGTLQIMVTPEIWVKTADSDGWQIYEPKEEPPKEPDNLYLNIKPSNTADWCFDKKNLLVLVDDNFKGIVGENVTREQVGEIAKLLTEPATQYKVGDWVEHKKSKEQGRITYISSDIYDVIDVELYGEDELETYTKSDFNADFRKLSPSEVVIDFGSFSGWIKRASNYNIEVYSKGNCWLANLRFDMLDAPTRELVEGLLKAQNEEKLKGDNND
jgi:hypothetical protein